MKKILFLFSLSALLFSCGGEKKSEGEKTKGTNTEVAETTKCDKKCDKKECCKKGDHDHSKCNHDHSKCSHGKASGWDELDDYHKLMAATYHPAAEGDMEPLMAKAREMATAAQTWAASEKPENCSASQGSLDSLATETSALADMVEADGDIEEIRAALNTLHNNFHNLVEGCGESCSAGGHDHSKCNHEGHDHKHDHGHEH